MSRFVTFLSDFGTSDDFVGVCHGVICSVCPEARVIHLTHGIEPQAVAQGARVLAGAVPYLPAGVHVAVVDPGVGSERRAVALRSADGRHFVGPDNGLLIPAAEACGGIEEVVELTDERFMLSPVSHTFHGRDVFSPVAGYLAAGVALGELGRPLAPGELVRIASAGHRLEGTRLRATALYVDRFGNIQLSAAPADAGELFRAGSTVEVATADDRYYARCADTFGDVPVGEFVLYADSAGQLSLAINRGHAASLVGIATGDALVVDFAPPAPDGP
jgi:S-adenosyl-L-methionine hydrolase (adenosine-forming)